MKRLITVCSILLFTFNLAHAEDNMKGMDHHKRFQDADKMAKHFDSPERDEWQKPDVVLKALKLPDNALVADIGAGTGYFSTRIAKVVPKGKVYAVDLEADMVRYLGERAKKENLNNIVPVQASADSANLPEAVDVLLFVNAYHLIENRPAYFKKLATSLKPDGRIVIVDWRMNAEKTPPKMRLVEFDTAKAELAEAGFQLQEHQADALPRQYIAVFTKTGN